MEDNKKVKRLHCGHCMIEVDMPVLCSANYDYDWGDGESEADSEWEYYEWTICQCPSCKKPTFVEDYRATIEQCGDEWPADTRLFYPAESEIVGYLPEAVKKEVVSALRVRKVDLNAHAVLVRRALEQLCAERGAKGQTLFKQLENLYETGLIPEMLATVASSIRVIGNVGAHSSKGNVTREESEVLDGLLKTLLEYLYKAPALIERLQTSIKAATKS